MRRRQGKGGFPIRGCLFPHQIGWIKSSWFLKQFQSKQLNTTREAIFWKNKVGAQGKILPVIKKKKNIQIQKKKEKKVLTLILQLS